MTTQNHQIARDFLAALSRGSLPDDLLTDDMQAWTVTSQVWSEKARYQGGVGLLATIFHDGLHYTADAVTTEDDRVAIEAQARGTLINGDAFHNVYVFILRVRDGRIASVREFFNPVPVREQLGPLLQAAMAKASG